MSDIPDKIIDKYKLMAQSIPRPTKLCIDSPKRESLPTNSSRSDSINKVTDKAN